MFENKIGFQNIEKYKTLKIRYLLNAPGWELVQNDQRGIPQLFKRIKIYFKHNSFKWIF